MDILKYKDYIGAVHYSDDDEIFFGKIEGINALVNFEGETVAKLKKAFKDAVDDYIIFCQENGLQPAKSYSGSLNIRIPVEMHRQAAIAAQKNNTSINAVIKNSLERYLAAL